MKAVAKVPHRSFAVLLLCECRQSMLAHFTLFFKPFSLKIGAPYCDQLSSRSP